MPLLSFIVPILAWNVPLVSVIFLKRSLVFPILLFSSVSLHWSLRKAFLSLLAILWNSALKWVYLSVPPLPLALVQQYSNKVKMLVAQSCPTLCDPMDNSLPGSFLHGISQARIVEWVSIPFSRVSSWPRGQTWVSHIASRFFTVWAIREGPPPMELEGLG